MRSAVSISELRSNPVVPCGILRGCKGNCLVLSMRHLGDAVIGSGFINALRKHNPDMVIDILGRPELETVIGSFGVFHEYIGIDFPLFGHHRRDMTTITAMLRKVQMIRRRKYDFCINLIGDVRENIIGAMTGAKWNIAPVWSRGHLFKRKMTDLGAGLIPNCGISIPPTNASFYKSMDYFAAQLGLAGLEWRSTATRRTELRYGVTVAIHPGASHASRHWPDERWRDLMRQLRILGYNVKVVGAHHERKELLSVFRNESSDPGVTFVTEEVPGLISSIEDVDVLIGMDSFSVHAAHALGVPVVVLNGSSDPSILTPPGGMVTSAGHMCKHYPCYYKLPCKGTESEYICVRGIEVSSVMSALNVIVARGKRV